MRHLGENTAVILSGPEAGHSSLGDSKTEDRTNQQNVNFLLKKKLKPSALIVPLRLPCQSLLTAMAAQRFSFSLNFLLHASHPPALPSLAVGSIRPLSCTLKGFYFLHLS